MPSVKKLLNAKWLYRPAIKALAFYIRFVYATSRKIIDLDPQAQSVMRGEENAIFAFWHGRMMLMPCLCPKTRPMHVMISLHRDGVLISDVMKEFGFSTIHGSTSKQGREALRASLRALKNGDNVSITPDGPRGPNQLAASGVATAARLSGKKLIPVSFSATRHKRMRSWDRMMVALPFGKIYFHIGAPIVIDKNMDDEQARMLAQTALNQLTDKANAHLL